MSSKNYTFCLLGSNSGRNAGDAAILAANMKVLKERFGENTKFEVPTTHPKFVESEYGDQFNVKAVNIMPWTGSVRLLGIPTFVSIYRSDAILITDGIIFDVKLFNPLFNFLITLIFLVPWARMLGKKVICYNVGIGPLRSFWGKKFGKLVGNLSDLIIVRDKDSKDLFRKIGVEKEIHVLADSVFQNWSASKESVAEAIKNQKLEGSFWSVESLSKQTKDGDILGVNITRYFDTWLSKSQKVEGAEPVMDTLARTLAKLKHEQGVSPSIFSTQVMDHDICFKLADLISKEYEKLSGNKWKPTVVSNKYLNNHQVLALASQCKLFIGMRLHSLIIASQSETPVVGMVYAPKVKSFLTQLNTPEYAVELKDITSGKLEKILQRAWNDRDLIYSTQHSVVKTLRNKALESPKYVEKIMPS